MVKSKKISKKAPKKPVKAKKKEEMSVDDAFADDEDVEYAKSKPRKEKKGKKGMNAEELEEELEEAEEQEQKISAAMSGGNDSVDREITFKTSKPVAKIKKGDKIKIDGIE